MLPITCSAVFHSHPSSLARAGTVNIATAAALVAGASLASLFDHGLHVDLTKATLPGGRRAAVVFHHMRMLSSVLLALAFAVLYEKDRVKQHFNPAAAFGC